MAEEIEQKAVLYFHVYIYVVWPCFAVCLTSLVTFFPGKPYISATVGQSQDIPTYTVLKNSLTMGLMDDLSHLKRYNYIQYLPIMATIINLYIKKLVHSY